MRAAEVLRDQGFSDFAASRAYYAMLYVAEAFLLGEGLAFSKHSAVIAAFGQRFAKTDPAVEELHGYLIDAHDTRNIADYDIGPALSDSEAAAQIERAARFVQLAKVKIGLLPEDGDSDS